MDLCRSACAALALGSAVAQAAFAGDTAPPPLNMAAVLELDPTRAQVVEAILVNAQERIVAARAQIGTPNDFTTIAVMDAAMHAICQDAERQLAAVLTPAELARLRQLLPPPRLDGARAPPTPM